MLITDSVVLLAPFFVHFVVLFEFWLRRCLLTLVVSCILQRASTVIVTLCFWLQQLGKCEHSSSFTWSICRCALQSCMVGVHLV